jgi:rhodanese-related sulfurtransferase
MQMTKLWVQVMVVSLIVAFAWACAAAPEAPRIDKETLKGWLADPQVVIVDVRAGNDWEDSKTKIKGAVRHDPKEVPTWAASLSKEKKIVLYCA